MSVNIDHYGKHLFRGAVAAPYLAKHGLSTNVLESSAWATNGQADQVRKISRCITLLINILIHITDFR